MREVVEFIPVCPEVAIGLGVPRQPIRMVKEGESLRLVQETTKKDLTEVMHHFAQTFLASLRVHGFILKAKSPSCGLKDVPIHSPHGHTLSRGNGLFASQVIAHFPHIAIESEKRLENSAIYEHFLTKVFTLAAFDKHQEEGSLQALVDFHSRYKFLLMAHHQVETKILGAIVANHEKKDPHRLFQEYEEHLHKALKRGMNRKLATNVLYHALGYFKEQLTPQEKRFFLHAVEQFRRGVIPFSALTTLLRSWIERFGEPYLASQAFFSPYPETLKREYEYDSLPTRDYWE